MTKIFLVRHGQASASFSEEPDPGLSQKGINQARSLDGFFKRQLPFQIYSSPLKRAFDTATQALGDNRNILIEKKISEIPSDDQSMEDRGKWLGEVLSRNWDEQPDKLKNWRENVISFINSLNEDTVIFTHFMVINTIVGFINNSTSLVSCRPDNCSITVLEKTGGILQLISRPEEAETKIN